MSTEYFRLNTPVAASSPSDGLRWQMQLLFFLVAVLAVISRRPDAILHPQFFAEDGMFWYADAYNLGWLHALFISHTGYFQTLPRLSAALSLLVPLSYAPLLLNLVAIAIQVLPASFLISARCANWGSLKLRMIMAAVYIALPNSRELDAAITEAQWHLALLAALVVLSLPSARKAWRLFDVVMVVLSGLTGPFCLLLLPVSAVIWWMRRSWWRLVLASMLAGCAAVQLSALLSTAAATRSQETLGATPMLFIRMLVGDVYVGAILGQNHLASQSPGVLLVIGGLAASAIFVYCLWRANLELKLFILYALALYVASLHNPMISDNKPQWPVLEDAPGLRYWFFPMLAFAWAVLWCAAQQHSKRFRILAGAAVLCMLVGVTKDWEYIPFSDHKFRSYVYQFEALPEGAAMVFPLYPDGWTMRLVKKGGSTACKSVTGFIDEPKPDAQVSGAVRLFGWVNAFEPVQNVQIFIDGNLAETVKPDIARPDVEAKFPGGPVKDKGWQGSLDLSKAKAGTHLIEFRAQLEDGCVAELGSVSVMARH